MKVSEWIVNMLSDLLEGFTQISMDICVIAGLIGAILYVFGWKKGKSIPFISYGIYLIIRILGGILIG